MYIKGYSSVPDMVMLVYCSVLLYLFCFSLFQCYGIGLELFQCYGICFV